MRTSRRWRTLALLCTAVMTAACVGDDGATPAEDAAPQPQAADAGRDGSSDNGGSEDEEDDGGPLVAYLYLSADASAADLEADDRLQRRRHELVAACMSEQGFEYEIPDLGETPRRGAQAEDVWSLPPDEFVARYGYGITTLDPDDGGSSMPPLDEEPAATGEPATLSPEEEAYLIALHGPAGVHDFRQGPYTGPDGPDDRGCFGEARATIEAEEGGGGAVDLSPFDALADEISALWERIDQDARVLQATEDWSACMADAGHPGLEDLPDGQAMVRERLRALTPDPEGGPTTGGDGSAGDDLSDDLGNTGPVAALAASDPAALEELRSLERSLAAAERECRRAYDRTRWAVRDEHEHRFIEANRDELERYRDALATAHGGA